MQDRIIHAAPLHLRNKICETNQVCADKGYPVSAREDTMVPSIDIDFVTGRNLTNDQHDARSTVRISDMFNPKVGKNDLFTQKIQVTNDKPVWQPA